MAGFQGLSLKLVKKFRQGNAYELQKLVTDVPRSPDRLVVHNVLLLVV